MTLPPLNVDLTGVIKTIKDTGRIFMGGGIEKKKYIIAFDDGYEAEYCPPKYHTIHFTEGEFVTYRITFRNDKGDTIEVLVNDGSGKTPKPNQSGPTLRTNSMLGHPAVVALTVAKDMAMAKGWSWEEMMQHSEEALQWLTTKRDMDNF